MTIGDLIAACPKLTESTIRGAYYHIARAVKLNPIALTLVCSDVPVTDLTTLNVEINDGSDAYPVYIKEIAEVVCETRLDNPPDITIEPPPPPPPTIVNGETIAYLDQLSNAGSSDYQLWIDSLFTALKNNNLLDKLYHFWLLANKDYAASYVNLIKPSGVKLSLMGSMLPENGFTPYGGWNANGVDGRGLDTGYTSDNIGDGWAADYCSASAFLSDDIMLNGYDLGYSGFGLNPSWTSLSFCSTCHESAPSNSIDTDKAPTSTGFFTMERRTLSTGHRSSVYQNGERFTSRPPHLSNIVSNRKLVLCAMGDVLGSVSSDNPIAVSPSRRTNMLSIIHRPLFNEEHVALSEIIHTFLASSPVGDLRGEGAVSQDGGMRSSEGLQFSHGLTQEVSGSVYYSNNLISCEGDAVCYLVCYCIPKIRTVYGNEDIPDHLVYLTLCKALSMQADDDGDVEQAGRYEAVLTQLINAYNINIVETLPRSHGQGFTLNAYTI